MYIENFERVPVGTAYANIDGEDLIAAQQFWPIMMSEYGFSDIFGYKGRKIGESLAKVKETWFDREREQRNSQ